MDDLEKFKEYINLDTNLVPIDLNQLLEASAEGNWKITSFALEKDMVDYDNSFQLVRMLQYACEQGRLDMVKILEFKISTKTKLMRSLVVGNFHVSLDSDTSVIDPRFIGNAYKRGHLDIIKYCAKKDMASWVPSNIGHAIKFGRLNVIEYVFEIYSKDMDLLANNDNTIVQEWLEIALQNHQDIIVEMLWTKKMKWIEPENIDFEIMYRFMKYHLWNSGNYPLIDKLDNDLGEEYFEQYYPSLFNKHQLNMGRKLQKNKMYDLQFFFQEE